LVFVVVVDKPWFKFEAFETSKIVKIFELGAILSY